MRAASTLPREGGKATDPVTRTEQTYMHGIFTSILGTAHAAIQQHPSNLRAREILAETPLVTRRPPSPFPLGLGAS